MTRQKMTGQNIPARPPRDFRLDIVRGWLQVTIFASHVGGSFIGGWLIHGAWGLSDSSEQFVFLSGFTLGSVFARKAARGGWREGAADIFGRVRKLYRTQLVVFALFGGLVWLAGATFLPGEKEALGWGFLFAHPIAAVPGVLTMLYQPEWMGILPVFIWCMILLPGFAWLERRFGAWALLPSFALYAATQILGLSPPSLGPDTGIGFNPFAWQILYLTGAWLGRRALLLGEALPFGRKRLSRWATAAAVAVVLAGLALRLGWYGFVPWVPPIHEGNLITGKESLALPRVLHAWALAWLVARFVPREAAWMHARLPDAIAAMGRLSLEVFCVGLSLSWAATTVLRFVPWSVSLDIALIGAGAVLLAFYASWLERRRARSRPRVPA
jgi:hypothetical protein